MAFSNNTRPATNGPRLNRYPDRCCDCKQPVPPQGGHLTGIVDNRWQTRCLACVNGTRLVAPVAPIVVLPAPTPKAVTPGVADLLAALRLPAKNRIAGALTVLRSWAPPAPPPIAVAPPPTPPAPVVARVKRDALQYPLRKKIEAMSTMDRETAKKYDVDIDPAHIATSGWWGGSETIGGKS